MASVFDLFSQDVDAIKVSKLGLGIGLKVVHELVTAHGGTVEAHSAGVGHGCQFSVTLPVVQSPE